MTPSACPKNPAHRRRHRPGKGWTCNDCLQAKRVAKRNGVVIPPHWTTVPDRHRYAPNGNGPVCVDCDLERRLVMPDPGGARMEFRAPGGAWVEVEPKCERVLVNA